MLISSIDCEVVPMWVAQMDLHYKHLQSDKMKLTSSISLQASITITDDTFYIYKNPQRSLGNIWDEHQQKEQSYNWREFLYL